jgi:hypothetical protein
MMPETGSVRLKNALDDIRVEEAGGGKLGRQAIQQAVMSLQRVIDIASADERHDIARYVTKLREHTDLVVLVVGACGSEFGGESTQQGKARHTRGFRSIGMAHPRAKVFEDAL